MSQVIQQRSDGRDEWSTPDHVYRAICERWNLTPTIDVMASPDNRKCKHWFTHWDDALFLNWCDEAKKLGVEPIFWMNPPYSQPLMTEAINKARREADQGGITLFLLPAWPDQSWYHDCIKHFDHEFWRGRIKFNPPSGIKPSSPRYGNIHGVIK